MKGAPVYPPSPLVSRAMSCALAFALLCGFTTAALANPARDAAQAGWEAYKQGEYDNALQHFEEAAAGIDTLKPQECAAIYQFMAYCHVANGDKPSALFAAKRSLSFDPKLELDPSKVAPPIREVFAQAKSEMGPTPVPRPTPDPNVGVVPAPIRNRPPSSGGAIWRSSVAPGWGQFYSNRDTFGWVFAGTAAAAVGYLAFSEVALQIQHQNVGMAQPLDKPRMEERRGELALQRNITLGVVAVIWATAATDAWYGMRGRRAPITVAPVPVVGPDGNGAGVVVGGRF